jgi:glycosyltransferase involved in cell wall biosynthesis
MKILRIIARLNVGGPARHVVWLTEGLKSAGCETVLVAGVVPPGEDDMSYVAVASKVNPLIVPEMSREISLKDGLTIWKLFRLMLRERPDIVHTHTAKAGTVGRVAGLLYRWLTPGVFAGRPRRCRFVHTYHGHVFHSYYGRMKSGLFLAIERMLAPLVTDRIVVVSEQQRREINEEFRVGRADQFVVIPLGIDLGAYVNWRERRPLLRDELQVSESDVLVGIVGRLTEIKNHKLFLETVAQFKRLGGVGADGVRFLIIGDGHLRRDLEAQAVSLGLTDDVVFLGTRKDPENFYPALDIVALTSRNEGTPLTLIEAMANARPVIATGVGGVSDLLGPVPRTAGDAQPDFTVCERGVLVPCGDADGFALGLGRLIEDKSLRGELGQRGRDYVLQNHSKERLLGDMKELYGELVQPELIKVSTQPAKKNIESRV